MQLKENIIAHIKAHGPMTVAEYMARCNAHYYATHEPFGAGGDFITAPEISQIFGELIGAWLVDNWRREKWPRAVLCEPGPGRGTLMQDALRVATSEPGFYDAIDIHLVETSPRLRSIQKQTLNVIPAQAGILAKTPASAGVTSTGAAHPRITWHETLDLPPLPLLLIANEFFDALPTEQYVKAGLLETPRTIGHDGKELVWVSEGAIVRETSPASVAIMAQIATHIRKFGGAALIIDYGYEGGTQRDTLQAVRKHKAADILAEPGNADLTAHVDFAALIHAARQAGAQTWGTVEQGMFLKRLGAELRATALCKTATPDQRETILSGLERLVAPHQMGTLFKVMVVTQSEDMPAGL